MASVSGRVIYVMNADGSGKKKLTNSGIPFINSFLKPDKKEN